VAPGITVKDRLRVLLPTDPNNVYRERDLVPSDLLPALRRAVVVVTNFHAFGLRETREGKGASSTTKQLLDPTGTVRPFLETPDQMVNRVCRELGSRGRQVVVFNDEAHHCYRRKLDPEAATVDDLKGEEKKEAAARDEEARLWLNGLLAVQRKLGIKQVYDLSATPFLPQRLRLPRGAAVSVGRQRLLAHRRNRERPGQDSPGTRRRRQRDRARARVPLHLARHSGPAVQARAKGGAGRGEPAAAAEARGRAQESLRRLPAARQGGEGAHRSYAVAARGERAWRVRPVAVPRGDRPVRLQGRPGHGVDRTCLAR
jgi:hypothetical protein